MRNMISKKQISHTFVIDSIEVPENLKKSSDFLLVREESKRKGKIIREAEIDEKRLRKK